METCKMCGKKRHGLLMAWADEKGEHVGHVCYSCEDAVCRLMSAGNRTIKWLETV